VFESAAHGKSLITKAIWISYKKKKKRLIENKKKDEVRSSLHFLFLQKTHPTSEFVVVAKNWGHIYNISFSL